MKGKRPHAPAEAGHGQDEALDRVTRALEMMQQATAAAPLQIFWIETLARAHTDIQTALAATAAFASLARKTTSDAKASR